MKTNLVSGFSIQGIQDRKNQKHFFNNTSFMATPRVPKTLARFDNVWHDRLPVTFRTFLENLKDKSLYSPIQALGAAFAGLILAKNVQDVKEIFPQECENDGLFSELKDYKETKAKSGLLGIYRQFKDLYVNGILKNGEDITVYLLKKLFFEAKSTDKINEDLDKDLIDDIKNKFNTKYPKGKYLRDNSLKILFGIKRLDPECQTSLRYTQDGYSDALAVIQSEAQKRAWRNLSPEKRAERTKMLREAYESSLTGLSEEEQDASLRKRVNKWKEMTPEEITEVINRLRQASIRSRFAMIDAWNHSEAILKELSKFLRERQVYKPLELLYSDKAFKDYQSSAMTDFWDTYKDFRKEFGKQLKESYKTIDNAIENGCFEVLQQEILDQKEKRIEKFEQEKSIEKQQSIIEEQKKQEAEFFKEEQNYIFSEYRDEFRMAYSAYFNRDFLLPPSYVDNIADIILMNSSPEMVKKVINAYDVNSGLPDDIAKTLKIQPDYKNYKKTLRLQRALEASIARELYPRIIHPDVFAMEHDSIIEKYKARMNENIPKSFYPNVYRIDSFYKEYKKDLSENELKNIVERYFIYKTNEDAKLIADYVQTYGRSALILFSEKSLYSNEVKAEFNEKFLRLMPEEVKDICIPVFSSADDIAAEDIIKQIVEKIGKRYHFMPEDFLKTYKKEIINTIHVNRHSPDESIRELYSIKNFEKNVCSKKTLYEDYDNTFLENSYITIPKISLSKDSKIQMLAAEQALADELYRVTGNESVYEFGIEELMTLFEVLSSKSYDGSAYFRNSKIKFDAKEKPKMYNVKPNYKKYLNRLNENAKDIFDEDDIKNRDKLIQAIKPETNGVIINEYINNRLNFYVDSNWQPIESLSELKNIPKKQNSTKVITMAENNKPASESHKIPNKVNTVNDNKYNSFIENVKQQLSANKDVIPSELFNDIMKKYGTEETSIIKLLQDNGINLDKISTNISAIHFKFLIKGIAEKEKAFAVKKTEDKKPELSTILTNAWNKSGLVRDIGYEAGSNNEWSIIKDVLKKDAKAEQNIFSTPNLIDAYLIPQFKKDILNYGGSNPIRRIEKEPELTKQKITTLKQMYRDAKLLENKKNIISSSGFIQLKKSINIDAMTESIENIEATYVSSFSKYFWTKQRKQKFADALKSTYAESAGLQLSDEIYESVLKNAFIN